MIYNICENIFAQLVCLTSLFINFGTKEFAFLGEGATCQVAVGWDLWKGWFGMKVSSIWQGKCLKRAGKVQQLFIPKIGCNFLVR